MKNKEISKDGNAEPGDPYKVKGVCDNCGHSWTIKGVNQIENLRK